MRGHSWILATAIVSTMLVGAAPATADVDWSGAGYYIDDEANYWLGGFIAGAFSTEADCKAALGALAQDEQQDSTCEYYASNPDQN